MNPVLAIALRDLRSELAGRQGLGLPLVALLLLLPTSLIRPPTRGVAYYPVWGQVPEVVLQLDSTYEAELGTGTGFMEVEGVIWVDGYIIPSAIRDALDGEAPTVPVIQVGKPMPVPRRSLLFALLAASTLTGAVSASIGGERARHTLQALLSAAITRWQIVLGKWLAWTGFGTAFAMLASVTTILAGRQDPGLWLAAIPVVTGFTVALGLWLVRRTDDVIAGTSVSLRVLPAVLGGSAVLAYAAGQWHPLLGASVPLGGALMAAGALWGPVASLWAIAVSGSLTAAMLWGTARDLDQHAPRAGAHSVRPLRALVDGGLALGLWAAVVPGPALWGWAGNPKLTEALDVQRGLLAGSALLALLGIIGWVRTLDPEAHPRWGSVRWQAVPLGLLAGAIVALTPEIAPIHPWVAEGARRLGEGLTPTLAVAIPVVVAQEIWFRGIIQRRSGAVAAAVAFAVVIAPFDPIGGVAIAVATGISGRWGLLSALVARFTALAVTVLAG